VGATARPTKRRRRKMQTAVSERQKVVPNLADTITAEYTRSLERDARRDLARHGLAVRKDPAKRGQHFYPDPGYRVVRKSTGRTVAGAGYTLGLDDLFRIINERARSR
jgi:hypothetical protein